MLPMLPMKTGSDFDCFPPPWVKKNLYPFEEPTARFEFLCGGDPRCKKGSRDRQFFSIACPTYLCTGTVRATVVHCVPIMYSTYTLLIAITRLLILL
jgi:hypothetical protein